MIRLNGSTVRSGTEAKSVAAALICHVLWGFSFLASRTALDRASVFLLLSHRFLSAFLLMSVFVLLRPSLVQLRRKRWWLLIPLGLAEPVIYFLGEQYGILHSNTIFSGVMIAMIPVVSTLAAAPILRERPGAGQVAFSIVSVSGVIGIGLMSRSAGALDAIGILGLLIAVASAAGYTMLSRGISKEFSPFERCYLMLGIGAAAFTVLAAAECRNDLSAYFVPMREESYVMSVIFLSLFCSVICYFLSGYALTHLSVARETVFSNLTTVVSVFAGAVLLHEPFTWKGAVCCFLILLGIYGVQRTSPERKKQE